MLTREPTHDDILQAMRHFDENLRDSKEWKSWEEMQNMKWVVREGDKRYPIKQIVADATDTPLKDFVSDTARRILQKVGFTVERLRPDDAPRGFLLKIYPSFITSNFWKLYPDALQALLHEVPRFSFPIPDAESVHSKDIVFIWYTEKGRDNKALLLGATEVTREPYKERGEKENRNVWSSWWDNQQWRISLEVLKAPTPLIPNSEVRQIPDLQRLQHTIKGRNLFYKLTPSEATELAKLCGLDTKRFSGGTWEMDEEEDRKMNDNNMEFSSETRFWRIHFPQKHWLEAREEGVVGIEWAPESKVQSLQYLREAKIGDRIVVYMQGKRIAGIGRVTAPMIDIRLEAHSFSESLFGGKYPQRIQVEWADEPAQPVSVSKALEQPENKDLTINFYSAHHVLDLTQEQYLRILAMLDVQDPWEGESATVYRLPYLFKNLSSYVDYSTFDPNDTSVPPLTIEQLLQSEGLTEEEIETHLQSIDVDTDLKQSRLFQYDPELNTMLGYLWGQETGAGLARRRIAAVGVLTNDGVNGWGFPALQIVPRLLKGFQTIPRTAFAPELGSESEQLLNWYMEANLITATDDYVQAVADAWEPMAGEGRTIEAWNRFLETLKVTIFPKPQKLTPVANLAQKINELGNYLLVDDAIVLRIYRSLLAGRHVVLSGPPGTGKTQLAKLLPALFWHEAAQSRYRLGVTLKEPPVVEEYIERHGYLPVVVTATEDWGVRDVVGGIAPKLDTKEKGMQYAIFHGHLTRTLLRHYADSDKGGTIPVAFRRVDVYEAEKHYRGAWLVIDEFTRAPVDAAFGTLLTTLSDSGDATLAVPTGDFSERALPLPADFRIVGTLNSFDRHFLNQMSEALKRRFDFIDVPPPDYALAEFEQGIALFQALDRLAKQGFTAITPSRKEVDGTIIPPVWENAVYLRRAEDTHGRTRWHLDPKAPATAGPVIEAFWQLFQVIRLFRQFGTAQAIAVYTNLFAGKLVGMEWDEAFDTALADTLVDQLQVMGQEEQTLLLHYVETSSDPHNFFAALTKYLKVQTLPRQRALLHTLREAERMRFSEPFLIPTELKELTQIEGVTRLFPVVALPFPARSIFRRRLHDLIHERGL